VIVVVALMASMAGAVLAGSLGIVPLPAHVSAPYDGDSDRVSVTDAHTQIDGSVRLHVRLTCAGEDNLHFDGFHLIQPGMHVEANLTNNPGVANALPICTGSGDSETTTIVLRLPGGAAFHNGDAVFGATTANYLGQDELSGGGDITITTAPSPTA
jgi:hypothetical protein